MAEQDKDKRTEKPSGRKLQKAYDKGQVPRSMDVPQAAALGVFLLWGFLGGGAFIAMLTAFLRRSFAAAGTTRGDEALIDSLTTSGITGMRLLLPVVMMLAAVSIAVQLLQSGWHPRKEWLEFDFKKLDPIKGMKRFVSVQKLVEAFKAILKTAIYAILAALVVVPEWPEVAQLALSPPSMIFAEGARIAARVLVRALFFGLALAVADYAYSRYRWYRNLFMTKQEVRDEARESEGSPEIKGRIRSKQYEFARRRMMAAVRTADVVVTNPTHVAVALKYQREKMAAPQVVAKGRGFVAARIREEAQKHRVPLVEDPPLARTLEKLCKIGQPIPEALYRAVAEVFAYVMGRRRGAYRPHLDLESPEGARP